MIGWIAEKVARAALLTLILRWPEKGTEVIGWAAGLRAKGTTWTTTVRQRVADRWVASGQ